MRVVRVSLFLIVIRRQGRASRSVLYARRTPLASEAANMPVRARGRALMGWRVKGGGAGRAGVAVEPGHHGRGAFRQALPIPLCRRPPLRPAVGWARYSCARAQHLVQPRLRAPARPLLLPEDLPADRRLTFRRIATCRHPSPVIRRLAAVLSPRERRRRRRH